MHQPGRGIFITFEGIEGCGKTTQITILARALEKQGHQVVITREPGGSPIANQIRSILLSADNVAMVPLTELFLYEAARAQHLSEVVTPALDRGAVVLCDRFTDATIAYQGYGRGLDLSTISTLNRLATSGLTPQLTLLFDCDVETGLGRAQARIASLTGEREERFELESLAFHERVRQGYLALAQQEPERFSIIPAKGDIDQVSKTVWQEIDQRFASGLR
jgi:dTMP kinase